MTPWLVSFQVGIGPPSPRHGPPPRLRPIEPVFGPLSRLDQGAVAPGRVAVVPSDRPTDHEVPMPTLDTIREAPKALLHDHLDGGLRPATVVELAREYHYDGLPTTDVDELAAWFRRGADRKSLELYLETFTHTIGVLQDRDAIIRVAAECAEDLAADGVAYAEVRMAPELSTEKGLTLDEVVEATLEGYRLGAMRAA